MSLLQSTLITQTLQLPRPFVPIHNNLISQQGGLICRSIVNDANAEGRLYPLI
jgi:hypothetical protein